VAVIDADRSSRLNGHLWAFGGRRGLERESLELLTPLFRQSDTAGRYGGEEFVLICGDDAETALRKVNAEELVASFPSR